MSVQSSEWLSGGRDDRARYWAARGTAPRKKQFAFREDKCSLRQEVRDPCAFQRQRTLWAAPYWAE
jgi:hypothetical protein